MIATQLARGSDRTRFYLKMNDSSKGTRFDEESDRATVRWKTEETKMSLYSH